MLASITNLYIVNIWVNNKFLHPKGLGLLLEWVVFTLQLHLRKYSQYCFWILGDPLPNVSNSKPRLYFVWWKFRHLSLNLIVGMLISMNCGGNSNHSFNTLYVDSSITYLFITIITFRLSNPYKQMDPESSYVIIDLLRKT